MLRPLLFLSALIGLPDAELPQETVLKALGLEMTVVPVLLRLWHEQVTTSASAFTTCFNDFYNDSAPGDCIIGPPPTNMTEVIVMGPRSEIESNFRQELATIVSNISCSVLLDTPYPGGFNVSMKLNTFGTEAGVSLSSINSDVYVSTCKHVSQDLISAAHDRRSLCGQIVSRKKSLFICELLSLQRHISTDLEWPSSVVFCFMRALRGGGAAPDAACCCFSCFLDYVCSVIGPAVVNVRGGLEYVQDRCEYTLLSVSSDQNLTVTGRFQERRRKDVSFLDRVTLNLSSPVHLEQGGRVLLEDVTLNINSTAQQVLDGVRVSKDHTGVTARVNLSNTLEAVVYFDGYTALIGLKGPAQETVVYGLCDSTYKHIKRSTDLDYPPFVHSNRILDSSIPLTLSLYIWNSCNRLREAPFTTCHNHTDPEPYISSCNNTLFCNMRSNNTLDDWWEHNCCNPPALCQDKICSDHEFCGYNEKGNLGCLCRAIFADPYRSTDSFGGPAICEHNSASVTLVGCLLEEKDIDYTKLHLNDESCTGQIDELDKTVTFGFNSSNACGVTNNSKIIYKNTIVVDNNSSGVITRQDQVFIDFSCYNTLPANRTMSFAIRQSSVVQEITSGPYNYSLTMRAYLDAAHTQVLESDTEVEMNQKIWMELHTEGLEGGFLALVIDSCRATPTSAPTSSPSYNLILNSCANTADGMVEVINNGQGTSANFSFSVFQFSGMSVEVYLHCHLRLCATAITNCVPTCNGNSRRRRSATLKYVDGAPGYISMAWTK
uniref:ZP domain-containing protein n=1 Tax=Mola mola TaxID=94237 RepID=A0A3Q4B933_MOLML